MPEPISIQDLESQILNRKRDMKPRDQRMDLWHSMYLLIDEFQSAKASGLVKFISNEPRSIVDLGVNVMARHPLRPRIPMTYAQTDDEREDYGLIEHGIKGAIHDIDRQMNKRGLPSSRKIAAWQLLLRGWAACRIELVKDPSPLDYEPWDMRFVLPLFDRRGLHSTIYETMTNWADVLEAYPAVAEQLQRTQGSVYGEDLGMWVYQYEFWDRGYKAVAVTTPKKRELSSGRSTRRGAQGDLIWAEAPSLHKHKDENDQPTIPVIIVPTHGLPFFNTPKSVRSGQIGRSPAEIMSSTPAQLPVWKKQGGWVADQGRSILAAVEETVPDFNELVSQIWQVMDDEVGGTYAHYSLDGQKKDIVIGRGAVNPMKLQDRLERIPPMLASPDTYRLVELIGIQIQQGTIDQKLLRGLEQFQGSGFLRSQMENAAMNALGPWVDSFDFYHSELAQSVLNQLYHKRGQAFQVMAEGSDRRLFKMEFGPESVKELHFIEMKSKPALPDDLAVRVNIATQLANPARPLASIQTIFDKVLEWEDSEREKKLLFDDLADLDPLVVLLRMQNRMIERGLPEIAKIFGQQAFSQAFLLQAVTSRMQQQASGGGGVPGRPNEGGAGLGMTGPEAAPPETAGIETGRTGQAPTPAGAG